MGYQSIYNQLRANGLTEAGALGMLGNWDCESNCESVRVQGDFSPYRTLSKQYTADVDSGKISPSQFANDQKGYGLAQWTYFTRKANLLSFVKARSGSVGSEDLQVQFAIYELVSEFQSLLNTLRSSNDLYQCTKLICYQYENPAVKNVDVRYAAAVRIRGQIELDGGGDDPQPGPEPTPEPTPTPTPAPVDHSLHLRTIDKHCSGFNEVYLLQSLLLCRGYLDTAPNNIFGSYLEEIVEDFQEDYGLVADGIVGNNTWNKLMQRG